MERVGPCVGDAGDGCTERAHFGLWLYRMGKTVHLSETETERILFNAHPFGTKKEKPKPLQNPVFLIEMTQFADKDTARAKKLKMDLREFLGVSKPFDSTAPHKVPGKMWNPEIQAVRDSLKIHICDDNWKELRAVLMKGARETSIWIRESFIKSSDVRVSSPEFLEQAFLDWMDDPCDKEKIDNKFRKGLAKDIGKGVREELANEKGEGVLEVLGKF
jgi:hypothetical protein